MSIFGKIASAIFGVSQAHASDAIPGAVASPSNMTPPPASAPAAAPTAAAAPATAPAAASAGASTTAPVVMSGIDIAKVMDGLKAKQKEALDWRKSIVDLMKLLQLDSSLTARKELATELGYTGDKNDSAGMNVWLHKQVMTKLAEHGGIVPAELKH